MELTLKDFTMHLQDQIDTEESLLRDWRENQDPQALERLFTRMTPTAMRVAHRLAGTDLAEDAVWMAFAKVMQKAPSCRSNTRAWILEIVANTARNLKRDEDRKTRSIPRHQSESFVLPDVLEVDELRKMLAQTMMDLPIHEREAVELVHVQDLQPQEAAAVIGIRDGTFRSRLHRGLARMRGILEAKGVCFSIGSLSVLQVNPPFPSPNFAERLRSLIQNGPKPKPVNTLPWIATGLLSASLVLGVGICLFWPNEDTSPLVLPSETAAIPQIAATIPSGPQSVSATQVQISTLWPCEFRNDSLIDSVAMLAPNLPSDIHLAMRFFPGISQEETIVDTSVKSISWEGRDDASIENVLERVATTFSYRQERLGDLLVFWKPLPSHTRKIFDTWVETTVKNWKSPSSISDCPEWNPLSYHPLPKNMLAVPFDLDLASELVRTGLLQKSPAHLAIVVDLFGPEELFKSTFPVRHNLRNVQPLLAAVFRRHDLANALATAISAERDPAIIDILAKLARWCPDSRVTKSLIAKYNPKLPAPFRWSIAVALANGSPDGAINNLAQKQAAREPWFLPSLVTTDLAAAKKMIVKTILETDDIEYCDSGPSLVWGVVQAFATLPPDQQLSILDDHLIPKNDSGIFMSYLDWTNRQRSSSDVIRYWKRAPIFRTIEMYGISPHFPQSETLSLLTSIAADTQWKEPDVKRFLMNQNSNESARPEATTGPSDYTPVPSNASELFTSAVSAIARTLDPTVPTMLAQQWKNNQQPQIAHLAAAALARCRQRTATVAFRTILAEEKDLQRQRFLIFQALASRHSGLAELALGMTKKWSEEDLIALVLSMNSTDPLRYRVVSSIFPTLRENRYREGLLLSCLDNDLPETGMQEMSILLNNNMLRDQDPKIRAASMRFLKKLPLSDMSATLNTVATTDTHPYVRSWAAHLLGGGIHGRHTTFFGEPAPSNEPLEINPDPSPGTEIFRKILTDDKDAQVRTYAAIHLSGIGEPVLMTALAKDSSPAVRQAALLAIWAQVIAFQNHSAFVPIRKQLEQLRSLERDPGVQKTFDAVLAKGLSLRYSIPDPVFRETTDALPLWKINN